MDPIGGWMKPIDSSVSVASVDDDALALVEGSSSARAIVNQCIVGW